MMRNKAAFTSVFELSLETIRGTTTVEKLDLPFVSVQPRRTVQCIYNTRQFADHFHIVAPYLKDFDFHAYNIVVSGRTVFELARYCEGHCPNIDCVDLYLVGHSRCSADAATAAVGTYVNDYVRKQRQSNYDGQHVQVVRSAKSVTYIAYRGSGVEKRFAVQVIQKLYKSGEDVICGGVESMRTYGIYYTGKKLMISYDGYFTLKHNTVVFNHEYSSMQYTRQLIEYSNECGMSIVFPSLELSSLSVTGNTVSDMPFDGEPRFPLPYTCEFQRFLYSLKHQCEIHLNDKFISVRGGAPKPPITVGIYNLEYYTPNFNYSLVANCTRNNFYGHVHNSPGAMIASVDYSRCVNHATMYPRIDMYALLMFLRAYKSCKTYWNTRARNHVAKISRPDRYLHDTLNAEIIERALLGSTDNTTETFPYSIWGGDYFKKAASAPDAPVTAPQLAQDAPVTAPQLAQDAPVTAPQLAQDAPVTAPQLAQDAPVTAPQLSHDAPIMAPNVLSGENALVDEDPATATAVNGINGSGYGVTLAHTIEQISSDLNTISSAIAVRNCITQ
jgi:hypothetical protein